MLKIGDKVFRNLQEQVGYNTTQIEKIFQTIDGLNVQDNVVIIPDMSYILSEDELVIVRRAVAFLVYNGDLYIKRSEDAAKAYFEVIFTVSESAGLISLTGKAIEVTLSNGALGYATSTVNAYSKAKTDELLGDKANLSGAAFTGAITSPSIIEDMAGYSWSPQPVAGLEWGFVYCGAVKNGNKVTFVCFFTVTKDESYAGSNFTNVGRFTMPKSVADKIIPNDLGGSSTIVAYGPLSLFYNNGVTKIDAFYNINKYTDTTLTPLITGLNLMTAGVKYYGRIEVTFLLSENLAS